MYGLLPPADVALLNRFQMLNKNWVTAYTYDYYSYDYYTYNYYSYKPCIEAQIEFSAIDYLTLTNPQYSHQPRDEWKSKFVDQWTEDDTMSWFVNTLRSMKLSEFDWPPSTFRIPGIALRGMSREEVVERMTNYRSDPVCTMKYGKKVFEKISYLCEYVENHYLRQEQPRKMLDLGRSDNRARIYEHPEKVRRSATDSSSDDAEDYNYRNSDTPSLERYGSDASKSGDELKKERKKAFKRPPGRPKGSGRKVYNLPKNESIPEFLKSLLLNPQFCPSIIMWEDYNRGIFRFVKPHEVAKLWGTQKQNNKMTFDKFSRAMRHHYTNDKLVSVRKKLVYQFGPEGPNYQAENPNFVEVKSEPAVTIKTPIPSSNSKL